MSKTTRKIAGLVASSALVVAGAPALQSAMADEIATTENAGNATSAYAKSAQATQNALTQAAIENIQGTFGWNQGVMTDNETLTKVLYRGSAYLCGALGQETVALLTDASSQTESIRSIRIHGDVANTFTASTEEYLKKAPAKKIMGCTCFGNPADGRASANAEVAGFTLSALINEATPDERANTITFTSRDGYRIALPLAYVMQRYSIIVTNVNGDDAESAIGCSNQVWLGSTSARSFARDIVDIAITHEANPPTAPGANADANLPNVGVTDGRVSQ